MAVTITPVQPASRLAGPSSCSMKDSALSNASVEMDAGSSVGARGFAGSVWLATLSLPSPAVHASRPSLPPRAGTALRSGIKRSRIARARDVRTTRSIHLHALLGVILDRARVEGNRGGSVVLVLELELVGVAVHRHPFRFFIIHRLHDVVGHLVRHLRAGDEDV